MKALVTAMLLLPGLAQAAETAGLLQVQPPDGWARSSTDGSVHYRMPPSAGAPRCHIEVRPPRTDGGDVAAAFRDEWAAATRGVPGAADTPAPEPQRRVWRPGWQSASIALNSARSLLWLGAFSDGRHTQGVQASGDVPCRVIFTAFFDSLEPAPQRAEAQAPPAGPAGAETGGLVGLWRGLTNATMEQTEPRFGGGTQVRIFTRLVPYRLLLLPDGTYTEHPPPGGLNDPSLQQGAARRGRYTVAAGGKALLLHSTTASTAARSLVLRDGKPCTDYGPMRRQP